MLMTLKTEDQKLAKMRYKNNSMCLLCWGLKPEGIWYFTTELQPRPSREIHKDTNLSDLGTPSDGSTLV